MCILQHATYTQFCRLLDKSRQPGLVLFSWCFAIHCCLQAGHGCEFDSVLRCLFNSPVC